eukprot:TRINITY_DN23361_c0_g1_i2.p1 TRINITY_DN23361_c0_g1~~TRINITY_DN23361_c0_g1_i2.p1  ORF type:complete len:555 (-),score=113.86 TRINITY_DN23361_c0_g1_i2:123-1763(-)
MGLSDEDMSELLPGDADTRWRRHDACGAFGEVQLMGALLCPLGVLGLLLLASAACPSEDESMPLGSFVGLNEQLNLSTHAEIGPLERRLNVKSQREAKLVVHHAIKASKAVRSRGDALPSLPENILAQRRQTMDESGLTNGSATNASKQAEADKQVREARCILSVLSAAQEIARFGINLKAAVSTCKPGEDGKPLDNKTRTVCAVNTQFPVGNLVSLGNYLATVSSLCTDVPNFDADCASAVLSFITALEAFVVGAQITHVACGYEEPQLEVPPPSVGEDNETLGSNSLSGLATFAFNMTSNDKLSTTFNKTSGAFTPAPAAPERRLFLGGGREATITACVLDGTQTATVLANTALAMWDSISRSCPPHHLDRLQKKLLTAHDQELFEDLAESGCGFATGMVFSGFARATTLLQMFPVQCMGHVNFNALCGAGIAAMVATLAAIAAASQGLYMTCENLDYWAKGPPNQSLELESELDDDFVGGGIDRRLRQSDVWLRLAHNASARHLDLAKLSAGLLSEFRVDFDPNILAPLPEDAHAGRSWCLAP